MSKLTQEVRLVVTRQFGKSAWDIKSVLNALRNELEAREKVVLADTPNSSNVSDEYQSSSFYAERNG